MRVVALLMLAVATPGFAQETRQMPVGGVSPPASIAQVSWLTGEWRGEGMGAPAVEVYSGVVGGQIGGHFVQAKKAGGVAFQEIVQIVPRGRSLVYRLRHFDADLVGWEDKTGKAVEFPLVAIEPDVAWFDGLTLRRTGDTLVSTVMVDEKDGKRHEISFHYTRVK